MFTGEGQRTLGEGCIASSCRVVFMSNGCAKNRHNPIAEHLIDRAFKAMHGLHHKMNGWIKEFLGILWVENPNELGRIFDIRK